MKTRLFIICVMGLFSACGTLDGTKVRQELGLVGQAPDEFLVMTRRPLDIPRGQALALPKPTPGAKNLVDIDPQENAKSALFGDTSIAEGASFTEVSKAESGLLMQAGASSDGSGDIRAVLEEEAGNTNRDGYLMYKLFPSLKAPGDVDETIDARAEAERLGQQKTPILDTTAKPSVE